MKELLKNITSDFQILETYRQRDDLVFINVEKHIVPNIITHLKNYESYSHLVFITAVDYMEENIFELQYMLHNYNNHTDICVTTKISRDNESMISIHHLWEQVWTYQRELNELFGIDFPGSPRVDEPFVLEGWEDIPPMRREFNTKEYSEKTYFQRDGRLTNDPQEFMKEKLYKEDLI